MKPADSVSSKALALWLRADWGVRDKEEPVAQWLDRSDASRDVGQPNPEARPRLVKVDGRVALRFDGKDDHLVLAHESELAFSAAESFSVSVWAHVGKEPRESVWTGIITKSRDAGSWFGVWIDPKGRWVNGASGNNLAAGKVRPGWHHLSAVQEGGAKRKLYVDGVLVGTSRAMDSNGAGDLWIAGAKSTQEFFRGSIGELRIYRRALSHPEVAHLAKNP